MTPNRDAISGVNAYVTEVVVPAAVAMARGSGPAPRDVIRAAADHGLAGVMVPEEFGGRGLNHVDFAAIIEAVARACASTSVILDVHLSVATEPLMIFGNTEQQQRFVPRLASGEWLGAFALTEPQSGSDAGALTTRAVRDGNVYRINGSKAFITNAGAAGVYVVIARTGDGARDISAFLVEGDSDGLSATRPLEKMGLRGSHTCGLMLDDVVVPVHNRLAAEGDGFRIALTALDSGRIGISAQAVGIAQGCLDAMLAGAAEGHTTDDTALADVATRLAAARRLCLDAAATLDAGGAVTRLASVAKLYATDTAMAAAHAAVELCAPGSADEDHPAAIRLADAKACQIYEGTNQIQRLVIARELLRA